MEQIPYDDLQRAALDQPQDTIEQIMRRLNLDISDEKTVARVHGILEQTAPYRAAVNRIAEIDLWFAGATGWGSWMVECANEREALANHWNLPHKYQARTWDGQPTD